MISRKFQKSAKLPPRRYDRKFSGPKNKPRVRRSFKPRFPRPKR